MRMHAWMLIGLLPATALAGRGSSNAALQAAIASGSTDAIVSEVERAEKLACLSCIDTVLPLLDHGDARVRNVAAWWLGKRAVRSQVRADALARLGGSDAGLARNGAEALGVLRDPTAVPALTAFLAHPLDGDSGAAAAAALGRIADASALAALQSAAVSAPSAQVRAAALAAVRALGGTGGPAAPLFPALTDADEAVRTQAIYAVAALADRAAVAPLMAAVAHDASPSVRKHAAWALGELGDPTAAPALTQAASDPDPLVRGMARVALSRLR
jgi:HEAT repeat protein